MARTANKIILLILKLAVSSSLLYFVLSKAGADKVLLTLKSINPLAFIATIFIYIFSIYVSTVRWRFLLPDELRKEKLFSLYLIGSFFNTFLPGLVGGDAVKSYYLYKKINNGTISLASVFMDRYIGFVAVMIIGLCSFLVGFQYIRGTIIQWLLPAIVLLFVIASFVIFGLRFGQKIKMLSGFYEYFDYYRNREGVVLKTLGLSFILQIMGVMTMYVIAVGFGLYISPIYFFIFYPVIVTISTIPISISGIGIRESSFVLLFGLVGIRPELATAMSFAWFLSIAAGGLAGLVEYLRLKK